MRKQGDVVVSFDAAAAEYDKRYEARGLRGDWMRTRLGAALELLGPGPGDVLDAGLGPGRLLEQLERLGWTGWGVDAAPAMVALARERVPAARDRIVEGRLEAVPFADETFDAVAALGVINYAAEPAVLVRELSRIVRPGGLVVIAFGNRSPFRIWRELVVYPMARALKQHLRVGRPPPPWRNRLYGCRRTWRLLRAAGLEPEASRLSSYTLMPDPLDTVFPQLATRLGRFAERRGPMVRRIAALHLIVAARKTSPHS